MKKMFFDQVWYTHTQSEGYGNIACSKNLDIKIHNYHRYCNYNDVYSDSSDYYSINSYYINGKGNAVYSLTTYLGKTHEDNTNREGLYFYPF